MEPQTKSEKRDPDPSRRRTASLVVLSLLILVILWWFGGHITRTAVKAFTPKVATSTPTVTPSPTKTSTPTPTATPDKKKLPAEIEFGKEELPDYTYRWSEIFYPQGDPNPFNDMAVVDQRIYFASRTGLWVFDLNRKKWLRFWTVNPYVHSANEEEGSDFSVPAFFKLIYAKPYLYAASADGVLRIDLSSDKFVNYGRMNEVVSRYVRNIALSDNYLWISYDSVLRFSLKHPIYRWEGLSQLGKFMEEYPFYLTRISLKDRQAEHLVLPRVHPTRDETMCGSNFPTLELDGNPTDLLWDGSSLWVTLRTQVCRYKENSPTPDCWPMEEGRLFMDGGALYHSGFARRTFDPKQNKWIDETNRFNVQSAARHDDLLWIGSSYDIQYASRFVLAYIRDFKKAPEVAVVFPSKTEFRFMKSQGEYLWFSTKNDLFRWNPSQKKGTLLKFTFKPLNGSSGYFSMDVQEKETFAEDKELGFPVFKGN